MQLHSWIIGARDVPTRSRIVATHAFFCVAVEAVSEDEEQNILRRVDSILVKRSPRSRAHLKMLLESAVPSDTEASVVVGYVRGSELIVWCHQSAGLIVVRQGQAAAILSGEGVGSGTVFNGDRVVFATKTGFSRVSEKGIDQVFIDTDARALEQQLELLMVEKSGAVIVVEVSETVREERVNRAWNWGTQGVHMLKQLPHRVGAFFSSLRTASPHTRRVLLVRMGVIGLVIGVSFFGLRQYSAYRKETAEITAVLGVTEHKFNEAMALVDLNPVRARQLLVEAHDELERLAAEKSLTDTQQNSILSLGEKIQGSQTIATRSYPVAPEFFFDLSVIKSGASGYRFALSANQLVVLDRNSQSLYAISLTAKSSSIIGGGSDIGEALDVAVYGGVPYVLTHRGVVVFQPGKKGVQMITADERWGDVQALTVFDGNVYILDSGEDHIWKYTATGTGFSDIYQYLAPDTFPDLEGAQSFAIDGFLWVMKGDTMLQFQYGTPLSFTFSGLDRAFGGGSTIYTSDTEKHLYILDAEHNRLVVFDKKGTYQSQYFWETPLTISDFVVSESVRRAFLLTAQGMYTFPIQ